MIYLHDLECHPPVSCFPMFWWGLGGRKVGFPCLPFVSLEIWRKYFDSWNKTNHPTASAPNNKPLLSIGLQMLCKYLLLSMLAVPRNSSRLCTVYACPFLNRSLGLEKGFLRCSVLDSAVRVPHPLEIHWQNFISMVR